MKVFSLAWDEQRLKNGSEQIYSALDLTDE